MEQCVFRECYSTKKSITTSYIVLTNQPLWKHIEDTVGNAESWPTLHMSVVAPGNDFTVPNKWISSQLCCCCCCCYCRCFLLHKEVVSPLVFFQTVKKQEDTKASYSAACRIPANSRVPGTMACRRPRDGMYVRSNLCLRISHKATSTLIPHPAPQLQPGWTAHNEKEIRTH